MTSINRRRSTHSLTSCLAFRVRAAMLVALAVASGCARSYFGYGVCRVDCTYCPPPPLPCVCYPGNVCHSAAVQPYLHVPMTERTGNLATRPHGGGTELTETQGAGRQAD